ncbi:4Fe-4S dicluster domain-containing protein [Mycolicibacterium sp. XJ1819]
MSASTQRGTLGTVVIDIPACKGCELCVVVCPPRVLEMAEEHNEQGYRYPRLLEGCIACGLCAQICPDTVFQVWRFT